MKKTLEFLEWPGPRVLPLLVPRSLLGAKCRQPTSRVKTWGKTHGHSHTGLLMGPKSIADRLQAYSWREGRKALCCSMGPVSSETRKKLQCQNESSPAQAAETGSGGCPLPSKARTPATRVRL